MNETPLNFIPLNLYVLRIDTLKPFDVYIKIDRRREKYVLYSRKGAYFTNRVRQQLLLNNVTTIYIPGDDQDLYQQYIEDNLKHIISDDMVAPAEKSKVVYDSSKYLMQKLFEEPRAEIIARTKKTVNNIVSLILSDRKATHHLIQLTEHDYYTYTHSVNVGVFSVAFARDLLRGISDQEFYELGMGFFLHDIGKATIPIEILNKPGPLTEDEWKVIRMHPENGYRILNDMGFIRRDSAVIVLQHHERASGAGYPRGLKGDAIHPYAQICAIADTFDAMTTKRCYQSPCSAFESLDLIKQKMLQQEFEPDFFEKFVLLFAPDVLRKNNGMNTALTGDPRNGQAL
jgi:HD-GYP domain-containing protein (c-di-GMP phosphodiesterase class II)